MPRRKIKYVFVIRLGGGGGGDGGDGGAYLLTKQFWLPQNNLCVNLDLGKA